jgi:hypothetical protein
MSWYDLSCVAGTDVNTYLLLQQLIEWPLHVGRSSPHFDPLGRGGEHASHAETNLAEETFGAGTPAQEHHQLSHPAV